MGPIEMALRETFSPVIFGGNEVDDEFFKILGHGVKCVGLYIPYLGRQRRVHLTPPRQYMGS